MCWSYHLPVQRVRSTRSAAVHRRANLSCCSPGRPYRIGTPPCCCPVNYWNNGEFKDQLHPEAMTFTTLAEMFAQDVTTAKARQYVSPDGTTFLPAGRVFQQGPSTDSSGWRFSDNLDTHSFINAVPGS